MQTIFIKTNQEKFGSFNYRRSQKSRRRQFLTKLSRMVKSTRKFFLTELFSTNLFLEVFDLTVKKVDFNEKKKKPGGTRRSRKKWEPTTEETVLR